MPQCLEIPCTLSYPMRMLSIPFIREILQGKGFRVARVESIAPSLEDVFVSLTSAHHSQKEAAA